MNPKNQHCGRFEAFTTRRDFLRKAGAGFGTLALADLLGKGTMMAIERRLGAEGRGRFANLGAVWLEVTGTSMKLGERIELIAPTENLHAEADRI